MLHAVDAGSPAAMRTGMRVRARWADQPGRAHPRHRLLRAVHPGSGRAPAPERQRCPPRQNPVAMMTTPVRLHYEHTASPGESEFLRGLAAGRLLGQRCPACGKVYIPPRAACPTDGVPTAGEVELPDTGTVTTFCVVNVPFPGQRVTPPYVAAAVLLDGADIPFQHLILGCEPSEVRMGMRVGRSGSPASNGARRRRTSTISSPPASRTRRMSPMPITSEPVAVARP